MYLYVLVIHTVLLLEINGVWLKENDGYRFTLEEETVSTTAIKEKDFYFEFNFDTSEVGDEYFIIVGRSFISIPESHQYKPDVNIDTTIALTDVTSITDRTIDGEFCDIPFELNGINNHFCAIDEQVEEQEVLQCETIIGLSNCTLGRFVKISSTPRAHLFATTFQFNQVLNFESEKYYEFEFSFLVNYDECEREDLEMVVFLFDLEYFEEILYRFDKNDTSIMSDRWSKISTCFQVLGRNYQLQINASSSCEINPNKAFFAFDNIFIREKLDDNLDCLDIRITEFPPTTTGVSTQETEEIISQSTSTLVSETMITSTGTETTTTIEEATSTTDTTTITTTSESPIVTTEEESTTTTTITTTSESPIITKEETTTATDTIAITSKSPIITTEEASTELHTTTTTISTSSESPITSSIGVETDSHTTFITTTTGTTNTELPVITNEQTSIELNITITKPPKTGTNTLKIVIGVCILVAIIVVITFVGIYLFYRKRKSNKYKNTAEEGLKLELAEPCIINNSSS